VNRNRASEHLWLLGRKTDLLTENGINRHLKERILAETVQL